MLKQRRLVTYEYPEIEKAQGIIETALSERRTLVLIGNCWVDYQGRASSKLESGERIILIKEDRSLLVHRPKGYEPVNWQPSGCLFKAYVDAGVLVIRAIRRRPRETIRISFDNLYLLSISSLVDKGEFSLYASEEDMQRAILLKPSMIEEGLKIITYERKVEPGFIDLYGIDRDGKMVVIEIKRITAGKEAVLQLAKYVESIRATTNREVRGILVAPNIAKNTQRLLTTLKLDYRPLNPKKCAEILKKFEAKKLVEYL